MTTTSNDRVLVTAKGFADLKLKGVQNLNKVCENFLANGKVVWSMADYMGITGAGKGAGKHIAFQNQLANNVDNEECVKLASLSSQVIMQLADASKPLIIESAPLRAYFMPLLKARNEVKVDVIKM